MKIIAAIAFFAFIILNGCKKSADTNTVHINCDGLITDTLGTGDNGRIWMPNAFSPNGDGLNDIIRPIPVNLASIEFTIYDENNNVVFTTNQLSQGWSPVTGSNVHIKYYYKIQAVTNSNHKIGQCGILTRLTCFSSTVPLSLLTFEDMLTMNGFTGPTAESLPTCP